MTVLSNECILALQEATAAACVEALNAAPPSELWSHVLAVVNPVICAQARLHMERVSRIARLPNELLLAIFEHLPFWDRVRTATVCKRWRMVSLDAVPALWSNIPTMSNVDTYEPLLARARGFPVALTYEPEDLKDLESFCYTFGRNIDRIRSLRLILPEPCDDDELIDAADHLAGIFHGNAPMLESLVLSDPGEICDRVYSSMPLLKSPVLRTIELDGFDLSFLDACVTSPVIRTLRVSTPDTYTRIYAESLFYLSRMPALEELALQLPEVCVVDIPDQRPPLPLSLQHLHLQAHLRVVRSLVGSEELSRFQTLHITFLDRHADLRDVADLLPSLAATTVSAAVHFGTGYFSLFATDRSGRRRVFQTIKLDDDWHTLLPNVTALWTDTYPTDTYPEPPRADAVFPALEELTLDVTPPAGAPPKWPRLSAPQLRAVRCISETARSPLDAGNFTDYLRNTMGLSTRLERLVFDGVALDPETAADVDLAALAENVRMVHSGEVPLESYRVWESLWERR